MVMDLDPHAPAGRGREEAQLVAGLTQLLTDPPRDGDLIEHLRRRAAAIGCDR